MSTLNNLGDTQGNLIAGDKVAGTTVYNNSGDKLGDVEDVMIDKKTGRIAYAVLSFGGFLGMGDQHHPMPWSSMKYDTSLGGYRVNIDKRMLEGAPSYRTGEDVAWGDETFDRRVHDYYKAEPYWGLMP